MRSSAKLVSLLVLNGIVFAQAPFATGLQAPQRLASTSRRGLPKYDFEMRIGGSR